MSAVNFTLPASQSFNINGSPIVGAQLWFTLEDTNTPITIYNDVDLSTPLTNPVVANSAGRFPPIYYDNSNSIRARVFAPDTDVSNATPLEEYNPFISASLSNDEITSINSAVDDAESARDAAIVAREGAEAQVPLAAAQVALAADEVLLAEAAKTAAEAAKTAAEAARDTTLLDTNVYATVADGRAAVADGETFLVEAANDGIADLHRRTDANNSVFIETYASQTNLNDAISETSVLREGVVKSNEISVNAVGERPLIHMVEAPSSVGPTRERAAKAFTANATLNDNQNIQVGQLISSMFVTALIQPSSVLTAKVLKRATGGNHLPETGDDVEVSRSETKVASEFGIYAAGANRGLWSIPIEPFLVEAGNDYLFVLETVGSNIVFSFLINQPGFTQAQAGYLHTGTAWGNQTISRPLGFGFGGAEFENINDISNDVETANAAVNATKQPSQLRDVEKLFLQKDPWSQWKYPGTTTTAFNGKEGLANILGQDTWSAGFGRGVAGVDFGHITSPDDMTSMESLTAYFASGLFRLQDNRAFNVEGGWEFNQHKLEAGSILYNINHPVPLVLEDCLLTGDTSAPSLYGISQATTLANPGKITLKNCTVTGFRLAQLNVVHADIIDCDLQFSAADIIIGGWGNNQVPDFSRPILVQGNLMRLPGNNQHPDFNDEAHADIWQINSPNGLTAAGNTLYMPSTDSGYDEGSIGTTSAFANGSIAHANEAFYLGNILVGGAYTAYLGLANLAGASIKNHFYINNICGTGGRLGDPAIVGGPENYNSFGDWNIANTGAAANRVWKNIGFFYNRGADGYPVRISGADTPNAIPQAVLDAGNAAYETDDQGQQTGQWVGVNGIFNYDKNELTDRSLELILTLGREHGVEIIDPVSHDINPAFDLGNLSV